MDDRDETTKVAMIIVGIIVTAIVAFVVTLGSGLAGKSAQHAKQAPVVSAGEAPAPVGEALLKAYFDVGQAELSGEAATALQAVVDAAMANTSRIVLISGFHDPSGDPAKNAGLARNRALAARDALVAAGVPAERIKLRKPEVTTGTGDAREARRVEFRVQ
jgi:outer membrane protein OmpA-like peptidoglycan-associated protein